MTELEKKLTNALLMIRSHINEPEVITSILDKNIGTDTDVTLDTSDPAGEAILGELTPDNTEDIYTKKPAPTATAVTPPPNGPKGPNPDLVAKIAKWADRAPEGALDSLMGSILSNIPVKEHFGEGQAEGLADLLSGLKEGPNDTRW